MRIVYGLKKLRDGARAVRIHRRLLTHDNWTYRKLRRYQRERLLQLLRHAVGHSPFYRELYAGVRIDDRTAIEELPVVTKRMMMQSFDRIVTDPRLRLEDLERHLGRIRRDEYYFGQYRVLSTSGTTGRRGVFVYDRREWSTVLANALRWYSLAGIRPRFPRRLRVTTIGADNPIHVSVRMVESGSFGLYAFQRLEVTSSLDDLAAALNAFQPEVLLPYPSIAALLAVEQLEGRLSIQPTIISTHTEALTVPMAQKIQSAWGLKPFNHYGLTELPTFGSECSQHLGIHAFEDLFIAEIVDEANVAVPRGRPGQKLLLTNLYNFTQPLIRYEVSDMLTEGTEQCPCGRAFPLIVEVGGRKEEVIDLKGAEGQDVSVPPLLFSTTLESFHEITEFQIVHREDGIHLCVVPRKGTACQDLADRLIGSVRSALKSLGAAPPKIDVEFVGEIRRNGSAMGKMKLVGANHG